MVAWYDNGKKSYEQFQDFVAEEANSSLSRWQDYAIAASSASSMLQTANTEKYYPDGSPVNHSVLKETDSTKVSM
ncbi:MAG: hypothetical protein R2758_15955 [Bacteroidales bacterium]